MKIRNPPPVTYGATAERPEWDDLPAELREAIAARLGSSVVGAASGGGGFTRGFASVLHTAGGGSVFVKAARLTDQPHLADWYAHEFAVCAALPAELPVARPLWQLTAAGYLAICLEGISGHVPALPWEPAELDAALSAWALAAATLREPPAALAALDPPPLAALLHYDLSYWQQAAGGQLAVPPSAPVAGAHLLELAALEAALPGYANVPGMTHGDLRIDNIMIDESGRAWLCDWNWLCRGAQWFDTVALLVTAYASGLDADALLERHPTARGASSDALDGALAALSGYWLYRGLDRTTGVSPLLSAHQRWSGEMTLAWLADRRGWR